MMKKTLVAVTALLIAAISANAQSHQDSLLAEKSLKKKLTASENYLKPSAGSFSTELNINPFKGELSLNNSLNQIKFRYFTKPKFAWRFGVNISAQDSVYEINNPYSSSSTTTSSKDQLNGLNIGLNIGFEKHFNGTKRLSPFVGGEFSFTNQSYKTEETNGAATTTYKGLWLNRYYQPYYNNNGNIIGSYTYDMSLRAYKRFGLNVVTGFDFYMAKNFFFGYEFNFGFNVTNYKDPETTVTGGSTSSSNQNTDPEVKNNSFSFGPSLMNGIRIGYVF